MTKTDAPLLIPYGGRRWPVERLDPASPDLELGPLVQIDRDSGKPLRLSNFPYAFAEPPDFSAIATMPARLDFLRDHFKSYWGLWDKLALMFLDAYFEHISGAVEAAQPGLDAQAAPHGGLFQRRDWVYSALAPIPIAHLPVPPANHGPPWVWVDFAFWTGERVVALDVVGSDDRTRRAGRERLRLAGHEVIELPVDTLRRAGVQALRDLPPAVFSDFWKGVVLPSSPFRIGGLRID
jgi:hypothetical protein